MILHLSSPTCDGHVDLIVLLSPVVNKGTRVDPHVSGGEFGDVQVRLSPGRVPERLAIIAGVFLIRSVAEGDLTYFVCQHHVPNHIDGLVPRLVTAVQAHVTAQLER